MSTASKTLLRLGFGLLMVAIYVVIVAVLWDDLQKGVDTLSWQETPATTVVAYYQTQYQPGEGVDEGTQESWSRLALAYSTPDGQHPVAWRFDAAGLTPGREYYPRPLPARVRHVLNQGDPAHVWFNPEEPTEAVMHPGIPHTTGVVLFLAAVLLVLGGALLRPRSPTEPEEQQKLREASVLSLVVLLVFFAMFAFGISPLWVAVTGSVPPWWLLPACSLLVIGIALFPRLTARPQVRQVLVLLSIALPVLGIAGMIVRDGDSFEREWTEEECVVRLRHEHPVVAEYAAWHLMRNPGAPETVEPLTDLVLSSPAIDTRQAALKALDRQGPHALPALPALREARDDPANAPLRDDLDALIRKLEAHRPR